MIYLVYGASGSGKSEFAENLAVKLSGSDGQKFYVATMNPAGEEAQKRIMRHKKLREGKGFVAVEQSRDIENAVPLILNRAKNPSGKNITVLLECMSNLCANQMFDSAEDYRHQNEPLSVSEKILSGVKTLCGSFENTVIVSNNIFEDGIEYDSFTKKYMDELGYINIKLAEFSDKVYEVVAGIPLEIK